MTKTTSDLVAGERVADCAASIFDVVSVRDGRVHLRPVWGGRDRWISYDAEWRVVAR